jgi:hypothetical protein
LSSNHITYVAEPRIRNLATNLNFLVCHVFFLSVSQQMASCCKTLVQQRVLNVV